MHKQNKAVVIIPLYKEQLSLYEDIALQQCFKILRNYHIIAVTPNSLAAGKLPAFPFTEIINFDDSYFASIHGYNRLMLSAEFYNRFLQYEYMLIYQPDAFVFADELTEWCNKGYDYIGAPWLTPQNYKNIFDRLFSQIKNHLYVRYNARYKDGMPKIGNQMQNRTGNGGFSLRRISLFASYCTTYKATIDAYLAMQHPWFNEDIFWSIELNRKKTQVKTPPLKEALHFAVETYPERALQLNNGKLPFGCHAWDKHADFWRPIFKQLHYTI